MTTFGQSKPKQTELQNIIAEYHFVFPAGIAAANLLGFTTQNAAKPELATPSPSISKKLLSEGTVVHTRRPQAWKKLDEKDAALLDFLRNRAEQSELSPKETIKKLVKLLSEQNRLQRLIKVISTEPPRVRAMLGALCEQLNASTRIVNKLRKSLNPLSTFDFGILSILPNAKEWQAK
jgi:hypothetical protein